MGTRSSTLVDEQETLFKKNPRRVVRPAGEMCSAVVWVLARLGVSSSCSLAEGLSVQVGEAGAAPLHEGAAGSANPARATASCSPPLVQTTPSP